MLIEEIKGIYLLPWNGNVIFKLDSEQTIRQIIK